MDNKGEEDTIIPPDTSDEVNTGGGTEQARKAGSAGEGYNIATTQPDIILRHDISDEELVDLCDMRRGFLYEGQWTAIGVFLGSLSQSVQAILAAYWPAEKSIPISKGDLITILICSISLAIFCLLKFVINKNENTADKLLEKFRNRTNQKITGTNILDN